MGWFFVLLSFFCFPPYAHADEKITITTYYPSPYGSYNQLQTNTLGVGDNNGDNNFTSADVPNPSTNPGDVWIQGNVGIGTMLTRVAPLKRLILKGLGTTTGIGLQTLDSSNNVLLTTLDNGSVVIGTTTASPITDKLYIDNSIVLHNGGNKVIGFGWSPGVPPNGQVLMSGYPAEIRWNPSGGLLQLGIDASSRSAGQTPTVAQNLVISSFGGVGINAAPNYPYALDMISPLLNTTSERIQNTHAAQTVWQATAGAANTHGQINVFNDANWQGGVGMQVGTFNTTRGVSIVAGGNGVITVQPTYNSGTGWYGRVGINNYTPSVELDVNGDIKTNAGITLGGTRRTAWPTLSCRYVSGHPTAYCSSSEFLTGGGCYWREIEASGTDDVHGHPMTSSGGYGSGGTALGGGFYCTGRAGDGDAYAVCCQ